MRGASYLIAKAVPATLLIVSGGHGQIQRATEAINNFNLLDSQSPKGGGSKGHAVVERVFGV